MKAGTLRRSSDATSCAYFARRCQPGRRTARASSRRDKRAREPMRYRQLGRDGPAGLSDWAWGRRERPAITAPRLAPQADQGYGGHCADDAGNLQGGKTLTEKKDRKNDGENWIQATNERNNDADLSALNREIESNQPPGADDARDRGDLKPCSCPAALSIERGEKDQGSNDRHGSVHEAGLNPINVAKGQLDEDAPRSPESNRGQAVDEPEHLP